MVIRPAIMPRDADVADERVEIRVQHRLAAAERDDRRAERRQLVDAPSITSVGTGGDTLSYSLQ